MDLRNRELEEIQHQFAHQQQRVVELKHILDEINEETRQTLTVSEEENADPILSQQRFQYVRFLKSQAEQVQTQLQDEEKKLDQIREMMRQAHVKKKSLELLRDKQEQAYLKWAEQQQEKELEDVIIARFNKAK